MTLSSELCTTVETMYSLSYLYQSLGDNDFADRAETAAFNALPAALMPDWWAHQYVTQPNQPYARELNDNPFWNVNNFGQTFGLEPNYPCCTVNHPQGYPKFLANSFVKVGSNGIAHVHLSPGVVHTELDAGYIIISCETNYPFNSSFSYTIISPDVFNFYVRIPSWSLPTSTLSTAFSTSKLSPNRHTGLHSVAVKAGVTTFTLTLDHSIRVETRANDSIAVFAGPLLYALELNYSITSNAPKTYNLSANSTGSTITGSNIPAQARDYQLTNTSPWNIAIDPASLTFHSEDSGTLENPIWAPGAPPTWIEGKGCEIAWSIWEGVPGPVPSKRSRKCVGKVVDVKLVPYGSAKVHMAELPTVDLGD